MSMMDVRLRLTIRRHGLPDLKLVWPCSLQAEPTIAELLVQVNDVVPLEGENWGLEDYAVELTDGQGSSFECLHFLQVAQTFKHDDQVLIRSLLTEDLRRRRISGRHQISDDGIHLIDGIPFGRKRGPRSRPAVALPPRKRIRSAPELDEVPDSDAPAAPQLLLEVPRSQKDTRVHFPALQSADPDDLDDEDNEDEDEDEDYVVDNTIETDDEREERGHPEAEDSSSSGDGDLGEEIRLLQEENEICGDEAHDKLLEQLTQDHDEAPTPPTPFRNARNRAASCLQDAYPTINVDEIEAVLESQHGALHQSYEILANLERPILQFHQVLERFIEPLPSPEPLSILPNKAPNRPLIQEVEETEDEPLQHAITSGPAAQVNHVEDSGEDSSGSSDSDDFESSSDDSSDTSSDGSSSSDEIASDDSDGSDDSDDSDDSNESDDVENESAEESHEEGKPREGGDESDNNDSSEEESNNPSEKGSLRTDESSISSGTSSSSSSGSDDEDEGVQPQPGIVSKLIKAFATIPSNQRGSEPEPVQSDLEPPVLAGQGLSRTQKRNARRREAKRLKELQQKQQQSMSPVATESVSAQELNTRRQALLSAIASDPPEPEPVRPPSDLEETSIKPSENASAPTPEVDVGTSEEAPLRKRTRVDMGAGRRLLFGALGLKNPKSKSDEDKLKENLMKDIRPLKNHRLDDSVKESVREPAEETEESLEEYDWRSKIDYQAVECCYENVNLSEPPFPFVQRWDPQQQYTPGRKRKRNSQVHQQDDIHDDSMVIDQPQENNGSGQDGTKSKQAKKSVTNPGQEDNVLLNYDDAPTSELTESHANDPDDLPPLPDDLTTLPAIQVGELKPGMVITWKELRMSKETQWQPQMVSVTGLVISNSPDVQYIILAKRDRDHNEKVFDDETGQRIYDKFEAPDNSEDEEEAEDDGLRNLHWDTMTDTRLVQSEPPLSLINAGVRATASEQELPHANGKHPSTEITSEAQDTALLATLQDDIQPAGSPFIPSGQNQSLVDVALPSLEGLSNSDESKNGTSQSASENLNGVVIKDSQPVSQQVIADSNEASGESDNESMDDRLADSNGQLEHAQVDSMGSGLDGSHTPMQLGSTPRAISALNNEINGQSDSINQVAQPLDATGAGGTDPRYPPKKEAKKGETTRVPDVFSPANSSHQSSSPLPSLEDIWHTARSQKTLRSPVKGPQSSATGRRKTQADMEYEKAMEKIDNGEESDTSLDGIKSARSLFPNATQPNLVVELSDRPSSPFRVPGGNEVITISPSSAQSSNHEQFPPESYAEDDIDETYKGKGPSLHKGSGWVKERRGNSMLAKVPPPSTAPIKVQKGLVGATNMTSRRKRRNKK